MAEGGGGPESVVAKGARTTETMGPVDGNRNDEEIQEKALLSEEKKGELAVKTAEHLIRFSALANAGGVLATITVIGATAKNGDIQNILAGPLALFAAGLVCALLTTTQMQTQASKMATGRLTSFRHPRLQWVMPLLEKGEEFFEIGMLGCFILGCVFGVSIITFA